MYPGACSKCAPPVLYATRGYEKGAPAHSADPEDDSLRMVRVNSLPRQTFGLLQATSNSLRASTSLHSKNLLSHARLTQLPTGQHKSVGTELGEPPLAEDAAADAGSGSEHSESDDDDDDQYSEDE